MAQQIIAKQGTKRKREAESSKPLGKIVLSSSEIDEADVLLYLELQRKLRYSEKDTKN